MRCERALDHRTRAGRRTKVRARVGKRPRRRRIPEILDGRIVVGGEPIDDIERADPGRARKAYVGIVPGPVVQELIRRSAAQAGYRVRRIIGDLRKRADVAGDRTAPEAAERRQHGIVVGMIGIRRRRNVRLRVSEARNRHHRDRRHPSSLAGRCCGWGVAIAVDAAVIAAQCGIGLLRAVVVRERRRPVEAAARRSREA